MSTDYRIVDPETEETLKTEDGHYIFGPNIPIDGNAYMRGELVPIAETELELSITYNYSKFYYMDKCFGDKGLRGTLDGMPVRDSIPLLIKARDALDPNDTGRPEGLPDDVDGYWIPNEANARRALENLLKLAILGLDGEWRAE